MNEEISPPGDLLLVDSNLLQVKLCREASPWAYLLKSICVATPEVERAALELSEAGTAAFS